MTSNTTVIFLQGPPGCGKHKIIKQAVKKLLEKNPIPDIVGLSHGAPFLVEGQSPWRQEFDDGTGWTNPESHELSLSEVVQMGRARMRHTIDLMGAAMWAYSFKEIRPTFSLSIGLGPSSFYAWTCVYGDCIMQKRVDKANNSIKPQYIQGMVKFMEVESLRWNELGFVNVCYCPEEAEIKKIRKSMKKESKKEEEDPRDDFLTLKQSVEFSRRLMGHGSMQSGTYTVKTWQAAVDMCVKLLEPHWASACKAYEKSISTLDIVSKDNKNLIKN